MSRVWIFALLLAACDGDRFVVVHVDAARPISQVASLHAVLGAGGRSMTFDLARGQAIDIPPARTFAVELPRSVGGTLTVHVEARDAAGHALAEGDAQGPISSGRVDLNLALGEENPDGGADLAVSESDLSAPIDFSPPPPCPNLMLLVDYSGSTGGGPDGGTELDLVRAAVADLLAKSGDRVPIGLTVFGVPTGGQCTEGVVVSPEPAVGNGAVITAQLDALRAANAGNNDVALTAVSNDAVFRARTPSYLIMLTDNAPNCQASGDDITAAQNAAHASAQAGYPLYVIGLPLAASALDQAQLDQIAAQGGAACTSGCGGHSYYPVSDLPSLESRLDQIVAAVAGNCRN